MRQVRAVPALVAGVVMLVLAACSDSGPGTSPDPASAPPVATSTPPLQAPADVAGHTDEDHEHETPGAAPTWDEESRAGALKTADEAMRSFARPSMSGTDWWSELEPLLTPAAAFAYEGTDPANVPASEVTADPELVDESSPYLARVAVPTNAGEYVVLLARTAAGEPWLVERLTPPGGVGP